MDDTDQMDLRRVISVIVGYRKFYFAFSNDLIHSAILRASASGT